jgi:hypothetical protein
MKNERELNIIRGKILVSKATPEEADDFMEYVDKMEELLDETDYADFFGTEGWRRYSI